MRQSQWELQEIFAPKVNFALLKDTNKFEKLLKEFGRAHARQQFSLAGKKAKRALGVAMTSNELFAAHLVFAQYHASVRNFGDAIHHYLRASEVTHQKRSQLHCIAQAFNYMKATPSERPIWWNDVDLLDLSKQVVDALPHLPTAWDMRAHVLAGQIDWPGKRARTSQDYRAAAYAFKRHASLNDVSTDMLQTSARECEEYAAHLDGV